MPTTAVPNILVDPGWLFWAPVGSAIPGTGGSGGDVVASKFSDEWPVAWKSLGATEEGSTFSYTTNVEPIRVAELFDPVKYSTTERSGHMAFNLADWTLYNYGRALNGAVPVTVSGATTTLLSKLEPVAPGSETRAMLGWESWDRTVRIVIRQSLNGSEIESAFRRAPDFAVIPCDFQFEVPSTGQPFTLYSAGVARLGA